MSTDSGDEAGALNADETSGEADQPGLRELREAVANAGRHLPRGPAFRRDAVAGLNTAIANVPDGMANAVIVGVNPIYGLYATMIGPIAGGLLSSTKLMVITTTAAASLTAGQSLVAVPADERPAALFMMVVLTGVFQVAFGLLRFGALARFVSYSVTTGLLAGIAILLILSQLGTITGYEPEGSNRIQQAIDVVAHADDLDAEALTLALLTFALALALPLTPMGKLGRLAAIAIPSVLVGVLGWEGVVLVEDVGEIPSGIPTLAVPRFEIWFEVVTGALSLSIVILVQAAGVSQSVPNPDGSRTDVSRDFVAQGVANVASGFFRGLPVGGSMSATALSVLAGGASHWASILAGLWMAIVVVALPSVVSQIAMPALGALLMLAGLGSIKPADFATVSNAGWASIAAGVTTFLATLFLPIQGAVGIGVGLSAVLFLSRSAADISIVELIHRSDGQFEERSPPQRLPPDRITILDVYGHLFYAGARTLERSLPVPADNAVLILRLRGRTILGATLVDVLAGYAQKLGERGGRLYLTGVSPPAYEQVVNSGRLLNGSIQAYPATSILGQSTRWAVSDAENWMAERAARRASGGERG